MAFNRDSFNEVSELAEIGHDSYYCPIQMRSGEKQKSLSLNGCNFFVRNPLRSSSTALERAAPETFENGVSFGLTPPELGDRAR